MIDDVTLALLGDRAARIDREKWEPCHVCGKWKVLLYRGYRFVAMCLGMTCFRRRGDNGLQKYR